MKEEGLICLLLVVLLVPRPGVAVAAASPETADEVRQLFEQVAEQWNQAAQSAPTECDPDREAGELCIDQFKVEVAEAGLGLVRHRRVLEDFDDEQLEAFTQLMGGEGWTDREEVCVEPLMNLMKRFGVVIEFRYYSKDMKPLFDNKVGFSQCEELRELIGQ